jgi:hypothetical protein
VDPPFSFIVMAFVSISSTKPITIKEERPTEAEFGCRAGFPALCRVLGDAHPAAIPVLIMKFSTKSSACRRRVASETS